MTKQLAPGVYVDEHGAMHIVMPELLAANGYADTPENRETLIAAFRDACKDATIDVCE